MSRRHQELVDVLGEDPAHPPLVWVVEEFWAPAAESRGDDRHGWFPCGGAVYADAGTALREFGRLVDAAFAAGDPTGTHPHDRYRIVGAAAATKVHYYGVRSRVTEPQHQQTMHETYGDAAIRAVVDRSYEKFLADPTLGPVFFGLDLGRIKRHQHMIFRIVTGAQGAMMREAWLTLGISPDDSDDRRTQALGERLREAHRQLNLSPTHLVLVATQIRDAAIELGVSREHGDVLEHTVLMMEPFVVTAPEPQR